MVANLRSTSGVIAIYNFSYKSEKILWSSLVPQGRKKNQLLMYKNTKWPLTGTHVSLMMMSSLEKKILDSQCLISYLMDDHEHTTHQFTLTSQLYGRDFVLERRLNHLLLGHVTDYWGGSWGGV